MLGMTNLRKTKLLALLMFSHHAVLNSYLKSLDPEKMSRQSGYANCLIMIYPVGRKSRARVGPSVQFSKQHNTTSLDKQCLNNTNQAHKIPSLC